MKASKRERERERKRERERGREKEREEKKPTVIWTQLSEEAQWAERTNPSGKIFAPGALSLGLLQKAIAESSFAAMSPPTMGGRKKQ